MEPAVVEGLRRWIERRAPGLRLLHLEWYGGEPLLASDIVVAVQRHARRVAARHGVARVGGSMTTNGLLLDRRTLATLVELGVGEYQITLDGPRDRHDRFRHTAGGKGSFDRIWDRLTAAAASDLDFSVHLRIHVTAANGVEVGQLLEQCARTFAGDSRFRVALRPLHSVGDGRDATLPLLAPSERATALEGLFRSAERLGLRTLRPPFDGERPRAVGCYAAAASSFIVRPNGDLAKCTRDLYHPKNRVGSLHPDGSVTIDDGLLAGWTRGILSGDAAELQCPARGLTHPQIESSSPLPVLRARARVAAS